VPRGRLSAVIALVLFAGTIGALTILYEAVEALTACNASGCRNAAIPGVGAPVWLTGPGLAGAPVQGQVLTAGTGAWTNSPSSYTYQWRECSSSCADIRGAVGSAFTVQAGDVGDAIEVVTTAHNAWGAASHVSAATAPVVGGFSTPSISKTNETSVVTGLSQPSNGRGNGHDFQGLDIARAPDGNLFGVYVSGTTSTDLTYTLTESTDGGSSWTTVDGSHDAGPIEVRVFVAPNNEVYVLVWNNGTRGISTPRIADYGVDAGNGTSPVFTSIPTNSNGYPANAWANGLASGDPDPKAGDAIDSSGNLYIFEDWDGFIGGHLLQSGCNTSGAGQGGCYIPELAWTTGAPGNPTWHFTVLPTPPDGTFVNYYSFVLPDNNGGVDIVSTSAVACDNTVSGYNSASLGFTANTAISNPAYTTAGTQGNTDYMLDRVYDWHTDNLNAPGGPLWTTHLVSSWTRANGGADCQPGTTGILLNDLAQDAYRDTYGTVHVMYDVCQSGGTCGAAVSHHAILTANGAVSSDTLEPTSGYCDSHARITQDATGRFFFTAGCGKSYAVFPADTTNGNTLSNGGTPTQTTLNNSPSGSSGTWTFMAIPRDGTALNQTYLDLWYPSNSGANLNYARINLDHYQATGQATSNPDYFRHPSILIPPHRPSTTVHKHQLRATPPPSILRLRPRRRGVGGRPDK
jgi:hypothetical protein